MNKQCLLTTANDVNRPTPQIDIQALPIQAFTEEFTFNLRMPPLIGLIEDNPQSMEGIEESNDVVDMHTLHFPGDFSTNLGVAEYAWSVSHDNNT